MATKKTTTKAKTQTKKTTASRATSTKKAAVAQKAKQAKKVVSKTGTLPARIRQLNFAALLLSLLSAVGAGLLMKEKSQELTLQHLTRDDVLSKADTVLGPATRVVYDVDIRLALISLLVLSAILPLLYLTRLKGHYQSGLRNRVLPLRWVDLALSTALMLEIVAVLSGIDDLLTLKMMGGLIGATCALGWLAERQNADSRQPVWSAYAVSLVTGAFPWLAIAASAVVTYVYGMVRAPWYVYALYVVTLGGFGLLALNQFRQHRDKGADYARVERNYLAIGLLTKVAFTAVLVAGLLK